MIEERVEVREGDILIIHTGYHHFGYRCTQRPVPSGLYPAAPAVRRRDPLHGAAPRPRPRVRRVVEGEENQVDRRRLRQRRPLAQKAALPKTRFGDAYNPDHVERIQRG
jgi:hypothetical protein